MGQGILVVIEQSNGNVRRVAYEMLSLAQQLAPEAVTALTFGPGAEATQEHLGRYGADQLTAFSQETFSRYSSDGFAQAVVNVVEQIDPGAVFFPATAWGKDLAPRVAGLLKAGLATDCVDVVANDRGTLDGIRPVYAGKAIAHVAIDTPRQLFSIRPNVQKPVESHRPATIVALEPGLAASEFLAVVTEVKVNSGTTLELTEADTIVSGGRGIKAPENYHLLDELAAALGAATGSSRPLADEGWVPHSYHIGQTGKVVSPTVYFAIGISGAIQHLAGISSSKYIVAINNDKDAPIFKAANYGIIGDLFQVVPALTKEVLALKSSQ